MFKRSLAWMMVGTLVILISSVYAGKPGGGGSTPCPGTPTEVQVTHVCGMTKWIRVNDSATVCQILCKQYQKKGCPILMWIGGTVVVDASAPNGWYFDPNTIVAAEVTAEGMQATICAISQNPGMYAGGVWYVGLNIAQTRPAQ